MRHTLNDYFAAARQRPATLTSEQLRTLIDSANAESDHPVGPRRSMTSHVSSTAGRIMTITLFVSAAVGLGLWLNNSGGTQPAAGRAAMPGGQAARVQASNPGGVRAPAPLPETIAGAGKAAQPPTVTAATAAPGAVPIGITSPADFQPVAPAVAQAPQAPPPPAPS